MGGDRNDDRVKETKQDSSGDDTRSRLYEDAYNAGKGEKLALARTDNTQASDKNDPRVQKNADGSEVEFAKAADGKVHPVRIKYSDGRSTEYSYGADGKVNGMTQKNEGGVETERYVYDGKAFREVRGLKPPIEGTAVVSDNGTCKLTFGNGATMESRTDGKAVLQFTDQQGTPHKLLMAKDGSSVEMIKAADGKEHPTIVNRADGTQSIYEYDKNGKIVGVAEYSPPLNAQGQRQMLSNFRSTNGKDWTDSVSKQEIHGNTELKEDGTHVFKSADGYTFTRQASGVARLVDPRGVEVTAPPQPQDQQQQRRAQQPPPQRRPSLR